MSFKNYLLTYLHWVKTTFLFHIHDMMVDSDAKKIMLSGMDRLFQLLYQMLVGT